MAKGQKRLLLWGAGLMVVALAVQNIQLGHSATIVVGITEVILAITLGIALGITVNKPNQ